jgi:hypothetical protein
MAGVPFIFGNATTAIPLTNLDADFNTTATLGNASIGLGNTTTTVGNLTLTNVTITSGSANVTTVGNAAITGGSINNTVIGNVTPSTAFFTTANVTTQLNLTKATDYNLYASGVGANYMAGFLGIGSATNDAVNKVIVAGTLPSSSLATGGIRISGVIPSTTTGAYTGFDSLPYTQAASFTLAQLYHFRAYSPQIGAASAVTSNIAYLFDSTNTVGTNNYGFYGNLAAGTGRYNLYMAGTANNYLAGALGIGQTAITASIDINKSITGATIWYGIRNNGTILSDVTSSSAYNRTVLSTQAAAFTIGNTYHYQAAQGAIGAASAVTNQYAFSAESSIVGATNNYGFYGDIAAATGRYNLYMAGTAQNYIAGNVGINAVTPTAQLNVGGTTHLTGAGSFPSTGCGIELVPSVTTGTNYIQTYNRTGSTWENLEIGSARTVFAIAGTERLRIDASGNVLVTGAGGLGYGTGSGGAVTQATSRTTGVTLNKTNGAITLVSAAGSVTYSSFTVTNSTVAATDTIIVNQKSGTDKYIILVTTVAAGSFQITFATTAGVTTEQPVFNFAVIKAVIA